MTASKDTNERPQKDLLLAKLSFLPHTPLTNQDDFNFEDQAAFENFWKEFNHYSKVKSWVFNDYSTDDERDFTFNLNGEIKRERNKNNNE